MFKKINSALIQPNRFGMMIVLTSIALLSAACGSAAAAPANQTTTPLDVAPAAQSAVTPTQVAAVPNSPSNKIGACTLLTKEDASKALGVPIDTAEEAGLGGVCTYTASTLKATLTVSHTGGIQYMKDTLTKLGDLALVVPGLGDQAFYNTNSFINELMVLKGDAVYLIDVSDSGQSLTPEVTQAKEKALAVQLLSHLP
jgi:hypothetical protein